MIIKNKKHHFTTEYNFEIIKCSSTNLIILMLNKNVVATIIKAVKK